MNMIKKVFWVQVGIFVLLACFLFLPLPTVIRRQAFPIIAALTFIFFFLGIYLLFLVKKQNIKLPLKKWLLIMGFSSSGFLTSVVLHNLLYALGILTINIVPLHYLFEFLHVAFFMIGVVACPIGFIISTVAGAKLLIHTQD